MNPFNMATLKTGNTTGQVGLPSKINVLGYQLLTAEFYAGLPKELTRKQLKAVASRAAQLPMPEVLGQFSDTCQYLNTLDVVLRSTQETKHLGFFLYKTVLPQLSSMDCLLDIGSGDGQITCWAAAKFNAITLVDIAQDVLAKVAPMVKAVNSKMSINTICESIIHAPLPPLQYDLSVLSHVLYYVDPALWITIIKKIMVALKPGGILVVALSGDQLGKAELVRYFGGQPIQIDPFVE